MITKEETRVYPVYPDTPQPSWRCWHWHDAVYVENKVSMRQTWLLYLKEEYKRIHPGATEECYDRWANGQLDRELFLLGDFLS